jgi:uncharacterized repeat protein (TIGR01451 family)
MNKLFKKLSDIAKAVPKRTAAILLTLMAVLVPAAIFAAGSTRPENLHVATPAEHITFNQYVDNKVWGDEHDFVRVGSTSIKSISELKNVVVAQEGQEYYVYEYVHNNAASWLNLKATGVKAQIVKIDKAAGTTQQLRGFVDADNCGADAKGNKGSACSFWDEAGFQSADGRKFTMEYVKGSAIYVNNSGTFKLSDSVATASGNNGTLIGDTTMNGVIPGCAEHAGFVIIRVTPKYEPKQTPSYDVEKKVNNTTHNTAKPGDTMTYTITARNTGNVDLTNVKINDTLPAYYSSASETLPAGATGSIINSPHTVTIPKLAVGATSTITISYKIKGESAFTCGKTINFVNKVTSSSDQKNTEDRTDNNQVDTDVTYPCAPKHPSYDLAKTVDKTAAKPGDTLVYTLKYTNTGDVDLTNVVIKDALPTGINWTNIDINVANGSGITDKDKLFTTGVKIASVKVGGTVTIKITAKVANDAVPADKCGENKKDFVNRAESIAAEKTGEDNPNNNTATTTVTVNKDCHYSYDLIKTVDKATAQPGETVTYTLTFKNTGNQPLTNAIVKDVLPSGVTYVAGSTTVDGTKVADGIASNGLNLGTVAVGKTVTIKFQAKIPAKDKLACGTTTFVNKASSTTKEDQTEDRTDNNEAKTVVKRDCASNYDVIKTVDKATAQPGETLVYTITVKNTGETDLTNVLIKDTLPNYIASAKAITTAPSAVSGDLFKNGVIIAKLRVGEIATIKIEAVIKAADQLPCGDTKLINKVSSETDQTKTEDKLDNNQAETTVDKNCPPPVTPCPTNPKLDINDPGCKPCEYDTSLNYDDPKCVPPATPVTPETPTTPPEKPSTPEYIVATGPVEAAAAILGTGALTFGAVAYTRSRKDLLSKLLNK